MTRLGLLLLSLAACGPHPLTTHRHAYGSFWCASIQTRGTEAITCGRTLPHCERIREGVLRYGGALEVDGVSRCGLRSVQGGRL